MKKPLLLLLTPFAFINCEAQSCYRLIDSLKSHNCRIAYNAYRKLTLLPVDSFETAETAHYRNSDYSFSSFINDTLSEFWLSYLPQQQALTLYCRQNNVSFSARENIQKLLNHLNSPLSFAERYRTENNLLDSLHIDDLTGVEYWATITCNRQAKYNSAGDTLSVSLARILDIYYSRHWQEIISNRSQLRLYLKKSLLFSSLHKFGACNNYLVKFSGEGNYSSDTLMKLLANENDADIIKQAQRVLNGNYATYDDFYYQNFYMSLNKRKQTIPLDKLLSNPDDYSDELAASVIMDTLSRSDYNRIVNQILASRNEKKISKFLDIIGSHASPFMVPALMRLFNDNFIVETFSSSYLDKGMDHWEITEVTVADKAVEIISRYYHYWFPEYKKPTGYKGKWSAAYTGGNTHESNYHLCAPHWQELWKTDSIDCAHWGRKFFENNLREARGKGKMDMFTLDMLWGSPYQLPSDRITLLELLSKAPAGEFQSFDLREGDSLKPEELAQLDNLKFDGYDDMTAFLRKVSSPDDPLIAGFVKRQCSKLKFEDKADRYEAFGEFYHHWNSFVNSDSIWKREITETLVAYYEKLKKKKDQKWEEESVEPVIFKLKDTKYGSFANKINAIQKGDYLSKDNLIGIAVEELSYDSLPCLFRIYKMGIIKRANVYTYLDKDLGFLLPDTGIAAIDDFINNYYKMGEKALYEYYLEKAGIIYKKPDGQLDLQRIDSMLCWDYVPEAFLGSTNGAGSEHLPSLIRLLEFNFNTRLGHDYLFNHYISDHNWTFGSLNGSWSTDWIKYLEGHKQAVPSNMAPSFSKGD